MRNLLVWHRRDLRLGDNALYRDADSGSSLSVYIFDPSAFARVPSCAQPDWDVIRTGPHAAANLLVAVAELRSSLRAHGSDLIVRYGDPASIIPQLARQHSFDEVRWHEEPGAEEVEASARVRAALLRMRCRAQIEHGCTLFHPDDLPRPEQWAQLAHPRQKMRSRKQPCGASASSSASTTAAAGWSIRLAAMPRVMGDWRRAVRAVASPRSVMNLAEDLNLKLPEGEIDAGILPRLSELYAPAISCDTASGRPLFGLPSDVIGAVLAHALDSPTVVAGEAAAQARLLHFLADGRAGACDRSLADTVVDGSSKLSVPLALGCLSPRQITHSVAHCVDASWLASHMEMRDFFIFSAYAADAALFNQDGWLPVRPGKRGGSAAEPEAVRWRAPLEAGEAWQRWATGRTGFPLPDAAMRELVQTGYCSNRVRQNAASLLVKDLGVDWRAGAEWFQFLLADHEVSANWGNWAYFSGVGADPKQRHFCTVSQAAKYDPSGDYVRRWCAELASVADCEAVLRPYALGVEGWPTPLVAPASQLTWHDAQRLEETGRLRGPQA